MKRLIIVIMLMGVLSCASFMEDLERADRRWKERGYGCYIDPYYGNTKCGYKR